MNYPLSFFVTAAILLAMCAELWRHRREPWMLPAFMVFVTVFGWYYADVILYNVRYREMAPVLLDYSYGQVLAFCVAFRMMVPFFGWKFTPYAPFRVPTKLKLEAFLKAAIVAWALLFICAVYRMDWDVLGALFPMEGRNGNLMWLRAAASDAGASGFLVSTGGYLYLLVCASFGIMSVLLLDPREKLLAVAMMALTWPFFLLCGTRNAFLAVAMPWVFCYGLLGRQKLSVRVVMLAGCFLFLNFAFQVIVHYRGVGYNVYLSGSDQEQMAESMEEKDVDTGHEGLNMIEELCYINAFYQMDQISPTWGWDYWVQATGFIPRAVWPNKPMMGIEYAKLRGFGGGDSDIGVVATVSTGLIGQGVLEYGPLAGPLAPALLMAAWCGLLSRWWQQRSSVLRLSLFLLGLGTTFNLGRNITNIALWPIAFAWLLVWVAEKTMRTELALAPGIRAGIARNKLSWRPKVISTELQGARVGTGLRPS